MTSWYENVAGARRERRMDAHQPIEYGMPKVYPGDWMAAYRQDGTDGRLVFSRQLWDAGPFPMTKALPYPVALQGDDISGVIGQVADLVTGTVQETRQEAEAHIAGEVAERIWDRALPWIIGGTAILGVGMLALIYYSGRGR